MSASQKDLILQTAIIICLSFCILLFACEPNESRTAAPIYQDMQDSVQYEWKGGLGEEVEVELEFFGWPCVPPCTCPQWVPRELKERVFSDSTPTEIPEELGLELDREYTWLEPQNNTLPSPEYLLARSESEDDFARFICKFKGRYYLERQELIICSDTFHPRVYQYSSIELIEN